MIDCGTPPGNRNNISLPAIQGESSSGREGEEIRVYCLLLSGWLVAGWCGVVWCGVVWCGVVSSNMELCRGVRVKLDFAVTCEVAKLLVPGKI